MPLHNVPKSKMQIILKHFPKRPHGGKNKAEATKGGTIGKGEDGGAIKSCGDPEGKAHDDEPKIFSEDGDAKDKALADEPKIFSEDSEAQNKSDGDPKGKAHGKAHDDEPPKILPKDCETKHVYRGRHMYRSDFCGAYGSKSQDRGWKREWMDHTRELGGDLAKFFELARTPGFAHQRRKESCGRNTGR